MPPLTPFSEIKGKTYGLLTIISDAGTSSGYRIIIAQCDCGNKKNIRYADVKFGKTTNFGCVRKNHLKERNTTHGLSSHPLRRVWSGMKERCYYEKHDCFYLYGGRGIVVCEEWKNNFKLFYDWAIENGYKKGLTIDRKDPDGNYSPSNCRMASTKDQARNKRNNKIIFYNGCYKCLSEWAELLGLNYYVVRSRLRLGWSPEEAFNKKQK